ncbi:MAG: 50S ribosomal protein L23 [Deltaproteobacteria bacterium]|nr:50S ribosomal protein L23 [Deltaproteobacteria bacterium]MBW1920353.1 50S ribosomal protein L23 [Deltaproteobacteria bacterium]MBW1934898.1 50S ribosomal protein L23 [Deltaproteobacteria bacterium]MBW1978238.1 50S ribosomal protein L23 [Deltaproteobacteria bacterium]MBW2044500.1 50S ribosomal protein L23 [Deltaproteobacteria bacterium]
MEIYKVIKRPLITEKGSLQKELYNQVCLEVDRKANKVEIRRAVEQLFKTKVVDVKTMNMKGKKRRMGRNSGKRPDWKKAVVKLAPGQSIDFLEGT